MPSAKGTIRQQREQMRDGAGSEGDKWVARGSERRVGRAKEEMAEAQEKMR